MTARIMGWWKQLHPVWRAVTALAAALAVGVTIGASSVARATELRTLPPQVRSNTLAIDSLRTGQFTLAGKLDRLMCYAESQAGVRSVSECIR